MITSRIIMLVIGVGWTCVSDVDADASGDSLNARLSVVGTVLMPDGSPAVDAIVSSHEGNGFTSTSVRTDSRGRYRLSGEFAIECRLHARSADETNRVTRHMSASAAR